MLFKRVMLSRPSKDDGGTLGFGFMMEGGGKEGRTAAITAHERFKWSRDAPCSRTRKRDRVNHVISAPYTKIKILTRSSASVSSSSCRLWYTWPRPFLSCVWGTYVALPWAKPF